MRHYGAATPKPHWAFANASAIKLLYKGPLQNWQGYCSAHPDRVRTSHRYVDKRGVKRYHGNKNLKSTENYPAQFGLRLVELHDQVLATQRGTPQLPEDVPTAFDTFRMMSYDDKWEDANMVECIRYIRGLASRMWSCSELRDGLHHVMDEGNDPDALRELEAMEAELKSLEEQAICEDKSHSEMKLVQVVDTQPASDLELKEAERYHEAVTATPPRSNSPSSLATSAQSQELAELEAPVRKMVVDGTMSLDTASSVLGYRITGCSPDKKKARTAEHAETMMNGEGSKAEIDGMSDRGPPNDCPEQEKEEQEERKEDFGLTSDGVPRKTRAARNAKLRRLCQRRKNGSLAVPTWLHELWKTGNHSALSLQYEEAGYNKDKFVTSVQNSINRRDKKTNSVEEGWYSKEDMSVASLEGDAKILDQAYTELTDMQAKGAMKDHDSA
ncbi:unnamed protein product [Symbiodinium sp. CCMP2592]|nr:unnamed protein product [Symbiodinium sp. CCMP2592]CAE7765657.1 unnamed protein product [Symbiodinium sp. CCMP2592]